MLLNEIEKYKIYLASDSPRRHQILKDLGINYNIALTINVDETFNSYLKREEVAIYLSEKKSEAYCHILKENRILITADTIVCLDEEILGKPTDEKNAFEMLKKLSGKMHSVFTSVTIRSAIKKTTFFEETKVWFKFLQDEEIKYYIENFSPLDKAGAYGIQEWIGYIAIEKIEGDYFNVMGFPAQRFFKELENFIK